MSLGESTSGSIAADLYNGPEHNMARIKFDEKRHGVERRARNLKVVQGLIGLLPTAEIDDDNRVSFRTDDPTAARLLQYRVLWRQFDIRDKRAEQLWTVTRPFIEVGRKVLEVAKPGEPDRRLLLAVPYRMNSETPLSIVDTWQRELDIVQAIQSAADSDPLSDEEIDRLHDKSKGQLVITVGRLSALWFDKAVYGHYPKTEQHTDDSDAMQYRLREGFDMYSARPQTVGRLALTNGAMDTFGVIPRLDLLAEDFQVSQGWQNIKDSLLSANEQLEFFEE